MSPTEIDPSTRFDQRIRLHGATWADYERLLDLRGESAVPRITYWQGELELMSPSLRHEKTATMIGRLVEAYADETSTPLNGAGSWTIKRMREQSGAEPDECYIHGPDDKGRPDLAIEVVVTSGGIDKLNVYHRLAVPEVWFWRQGSIEVYVLRHDGSDAYELAPRSALLPGLDLELVSRLAEERDQGQAVHTFRASLRV